MFIFIFKVFFGVRPMLNQFYVAFFSILRDRALYGILTLSALFIVIPSASALSMRQVTELSVSLSFSLISFLLLLLAVFFGSFSIWRDIERRYTYSILSLPISRSNFILGKFVAISVFIFLCGLCLGLLIPWVVSITTEINTPTRPIIWENIYFSILFDTLKYILLCAFGVLFSAVSTSFFLPVFGTIIIFLCGSISQDVHSYLLSSAALDISPFIKNFANIFYYILPNFSAFNFKYAAIYSIPIDLSELLLVFVYFVTYTAIILFLACFFFSRRELR